MAYTNATFYIDLVSGSDAARTALTSCTASNPAGSTTRINKTAHGLSTGAVVDLTLFSSWLNTAWKITKVDNDNFDLDAATWQATADTSGTVTPRGGSSWADAWLTVTSGPSNKVQGGDEIRVSKTTDEASLGQNATFTNGSATVTLTSAVTKKIEDAISGWTAATNITANTNSARKLGATSVLLTPAASFTTGKMAYAAISGGGTQDFSSYRYINLWFRNATSTSRAAGDFKICLCSDATGDVIVNEINLPGTLSNSTFHPFALDYGGALSATVQSVAIYANVDPGTVAISINNIFASAANSINLNTVIGTSGDVHYPIQSVDGTTIKIDQNNTSAAGRGWSGTTTTETIYYAPVLISTTSTWSSPSSTVLGSATLGQLYFIGGYNTSNNTRDGFTRVASNSVGSSAGFLVRAYTKISYIGLYCYSIAFNSASGSFNTFANCVMCGGSQPLNFPTSSDILIDTCKIYNNSSTSTTLYGGNNVILNSISRNNSNYGFSVEGSSTQILGCTTANNATSGIFVYTGSLYGDPVVLRNTTILDSTETTITALFDGSVHSFDHDNTADNHWVWFEGANMNWQTSTKQGSDPGSWKLTFTSATTWGVYRMLHYKIAEIPVNASAQVTAKVWIKKDHATNVVAKFMVEGSLYSLDGISETSTTKASDTNWEQLTLTFTPTQSGTVSLFVDSYCTSTTSAVIYIGSVTFTQA